MSINFKKINRIYNSSIKELEFIVPDEFDYYYFFKFYKGTCKKKKIRISKYEKVI